MARIVARAPSETPPAGFRLRLEHLVCPRTHEPLVERRGAVDAELEPRRANGRVPAYGRTPFVLARPDGAAYPVVDGIPVLLAPELLGTAPAETIDLADRRYAEAYDEMAYYNDVARQVLADLAATADAHVLRAILADVQARPARFPYPADLWIDHVYDAASQWDAYTHLAPLAGKRVLGVGGRGVDTVKFLLAGAAEAWLATPMVDELRLARALAEHVGVADRLHVVAAVAEELPFAAGTFDAVYAGGSMHHTVGELAFAEAARVLRPGGRFAAVEPFRAPLYGLGTRVFGKREDVPCTPMTKERVAPLARAFSRSSVVHHGTLTRYPLLALLKVGLRLRLRTAWRITRFDDRLTSLVPRGREAGSSVALLGEVHAEAGAATGPR